MPVDLREYLTVDEVARQLGLNVEDVTALLRATILTRYGPLFAPGEVARVAKNQDQRRRRHPVP
jgi:hypothetical protein